MTIDKDFLSNLSHIDEQDDYKRNDSIQIGFEQELKSLSVHHGDSARFEAKISSCKAIDRSLLQIEWRLNDIVIVNDPNNSKYQFGCSLEDNRYWMDIQQCQQQDEKVYTIYISYDNGRLHDESSAYLFVQKTEDQSIEEKLNSNVISLNECIPPTIIRSLQSSYRYHPGEQLHFLVEYKSSTDQCHCMWQVQYINDKISQSIENGLIVNADCSSILIIESITSELQGLYTFYVENIYGRAMTQTIVIVNANELDDDRQIYHHSNGLHHLSSNTSTDYEDVQVQTLNEEIKYSSINGKRSREQNHIDVSLYSQRHIAYFDPSLKFEHVESIEQLENDDVSLNDHRIKNGHDTKIRIQFELPPPPPIEDILEEHIYEDIPNIVSIPSNSLSTSVQQQQQQSSEITDKDFSITEQIPRSSSSPNSLDEVLNHVEQWSDSIVDSDTLLPLLPRQLLKISPLTPSVNEYVDEQYINHRLDATYTDIRITDALPDVSIEESNDSEQYQMIIKQNGVFIDPMNQAEDEDGFSESFNDRIGSTEPEDDDDEMQVSTYLLNDMDQVIETIHVDDELFEAKKTCVIGIQAPNEELLSVTQSDNESTTKEILSNKIVDYIDIPPSQICSDDQKPEVIIVTTEEMSSIHSPNCFPISNFKIESAQTISNVTTNEQTPIISLTIIHEKLSGELLESLSVPIQPDLLPLATMPDQTMNTDEQRIPDRTVQDVLSASLEPTKINHNEGTGEIMPIISFASTEKVKDHDEFFDVESEYILSPEKPPITLAEAEKLQHDAAIEQKDENFFEPELDLALVKIPSTEINNAKNLSEEKLTESLNQKNTEESHSSKTPSVGQQELLRPKFSFRLKPSITINAGDNLKLEVHFLGQPEPKVTWYFKSDILKPSSNIHMIQSRDVHTFCSILTIEKIHIDYEGKFKVIVKNELGEAVSVAQVNVKRALIAVQLLTPTKKTGVGKTSTLPITNE